MISDMQDILEVQQQEQQVLTKESLMQMDQKKKKSKKMFDMTFKRPEGMHRELFNLLIRDSKDAAPLIPTVTSSKMGGYKHMKARLGLRRARCWAFMPFVNPARKDNLQLRHWRRVEDEPKEYPFARFNKVLDTVTYTNEEYVKLLTDKDWSREETDHLMELASRFDLRWPVMLDRFESNKFLKRRSVEDLKERYYSVCNQISAARTPPGETPKLFYFDAEHERRRKEQLTKLWNRTTEQVEEEMFLLEELRKIESRKKERERKAHDLQKLISAAEQVPPTPMAPITPSTTPKRKLPRAPSSATFGDATILDTSSSGVKFPEFRGSGVYLRSQRMKLPPTLGQKKAKAVEQSILKLGVDPHPMATDEIVTQFNDLRSDIVLLYELKSALASCEYELESLRHEYKSLTDKELVIPARLHVNSEQDEEATSPFKRRIADAMDVAPSAIQPRKRRVNIEPSPCVKKLRKV